MAAGLARAATPLDSQLGLAWEHPSLAQVPAIYRLLYNSGREATGKKKVGADLGLRYQGHPRAYEHSGQLQIILEHHHHALCS